MYVTLNNINGIVHKSERNMTNFVQNCHVVTNNKGPSPLIYGKAGVGQLTNHIQRIFSFKETQQVSNYDDPRIATLNLT